MTNVTFSAYALPLLHAAKYPWAEVCGVLLGKLGATGVTDVTHAIPFFHHWTSQTPMLEVALQQAELYAKQKDLTIVGWYQANEREDDKSLHANAIRVADTIRRNSQHALIFLIRNEKLANLEKNEGAITPYIYKEQQWRPVSQAFTPGNEFKFTYDETFAKLRGLMSGAVYTKVNDFDEHLENVSLDWLEQKHIPL
ncbi:uncharacterized protein BYT42DRAFT_573999 [Radiomyces spectabilis]|uniref:uncharacterized protein n=1 Tax=Radiomyces spectabilis TaxID=64574 RepID=UPI00221E4321|nr:uncharacterized protein BYT42DRAFT_573999 [Radiomyces spectabilis]KAI8376271.1 hypothetical protein BYT42DRAFT_573999 [Radiomyces spectabilis]